jgi:hypothetical protein
MPQIFVSHTRKDKRFCDEFDIRTCARVERINCYRSEFEDISPPAWKTIRNAINKSVALFFLVGKELVKSQDMSDPEWRYTQNWIASEIGLACQRGIDVWAICDGVDVNFPMPYVNNYFIFDMKIKWTFEYMRSILENYGLGNTFPFPYEESGTRCPYCRIEFNLHNPLSPGYVITCPQCLRKFVFRSGHPLNTWPPPHPLKIHANK